MNFVSAESSPYMAVRTASWEAANIFLPTTTIVSKIMFIERAFERYFDTVSRMQMAHYQAGHTIFSLQNSRLVKIIETVRSKCFQSNY